MTSPELEPMFVGALFEAPSIDDAKKIIGAGDLSPANMVDPVMRVALRFAMEQLGRGEKPTAATVFTQGHLEHLFTDTDGERLRRIEQGNLLGLDEVIQVAKQIRRYAHSRKIGTSLQALGAAVTHGRDKNGNPFGPNEALPHFESMLRDYKALFAEGRTGSEAVLAARADYETRRKSGKALITPSGFPVIDKELGGYPHKLVWILAAPGKGKSAFLGTQIGLHARMGLTTVLASLEDNDQWLVQRHVALGTGMKQREVYSSDFPDEEKAQVIEKRLYDEWQNLWIVTKQHCRTASDVVRIFEQYLVQKQATVFALDNLTAVKHVLESKNDEPRRAAGRSIERFAEFADVFNVPLLCLAHTTRDYWQRTQGRSPPDISDTAETADADRYVRLGFSIWQKGPELRVTVNKNTLQGSTVGTTFAFDAHVDQGLIDVDSGYTVDLAKEKREESEARARTKKEKADKVAADKKERDKATKIELDAAREKAKQEREAKKLADKEAKALEKAKAQPAQPALFEEPAK